VGSLDNRRAQQWPGALNVFSVLASGLKGFVIIGAVVLDKYSRRK
jgi:hypothetical protein